MIKDTISYVLENAPEEMEFFNQFIDTGLLDRINNVIHSDFARITYTDAVKELEKANIEEIKPINIITIYKKVLEQAIKEKDKARAKPIFMTVARLSVGNRRFSGSSSTHTKKKINM